MSVGHDRHSAAYFFIPDPLPRELTDSGLCAVPELWPEGLWDYSVSGETTSQRHRRRALAESICEGCPVRELCAQYAADNGLSGVWGGVVFRPTGIGSSVEPGNNANARFLGKRANGRSVGARRTV
ncbi:WhiB family transcriptional regulator [Corynebacterium sp. CCUG 69979]|uniref:WhiB family transcriptional regulator n=1 Tax=Corynebacterium sp. CCUG 69979 TaxID=2823890 RepID=UPI00336CBE54|nr:WhiB family transcriptional regulator [Corynebacterium sp. CCUG 69979]